MEEIDVEAVYVLAKVRPKSVLLYKPVPLAIYIMLSFEGSMLINSKFPVPIGFVFCCTQAPLVSLYKLLYPAKASTLKGDSLYVMDKMGNILVANTNDRKFLKIATTKLKQISCLYYYSNTFLIGTRSGLYK